MTKKTKPLEIKHIPVVGHACYMPSGSDSYGYKISKVADDKSWFEFEDKDGNYRGTAVLITRWNSRARGYYSPIGQDGSPTFQVCTRSWFGIIYPSDEEGCGETYLDPSF